MLFFTTYFLVGTAQRLGEYFLEKWQSVCNFGITCASLRPQTKSVCFRIGHHHLRWSGHCFMLWSMYLCKADDSMSKTPSSTSNVLIVDIKLDIKISWNIYRRLTLTEYWCVILEHDLQKNDLQYISWTNNIQLNSDFTSKYFQRGN